MMLALKKKNHPFVLVEKAWCSKLLHLQTWKGGREVPIDTRQTPCDKQQGGRSNNKHFRPKPQNMCEIVGAKSNKWRTCNNNVKCEVVMQWQMGAWNNNEVR